MRPTRRAATAALAKIKKAGQRVQRAVASMSTIPDQIPASPITTASETETSTVEAESVEEVSAVVPLSPPTTIPASPTTIPASPDTNESVQLIKIVERKPVVKDKELKRRRGTVFHIAAPVFSLADAEESIDETVEATEELSVPQIVDETVFVQNSQELIIEEPTVSKFDANQNEEVDDKTTIKAESSRPPISELESIKDGNKTEEVNKIKSNIYVRYEKKGGKRRRIIEVQEIHPSLRVKPSTSSIRTTEANVESKKMRWIDDETGAPLYEQRDMTLPAEQFGRTVRAGTRKQTMYNKVI